MWPANDDQDESQAVPAANGHHYVTLQAGLSLCERCGHIWYWTEAKPLECPPED